MKLSAETLNVLKNFASINSNIVIKAGNTIKTMAEAKNVLGSADIAETFDSEFGIYDLNEFLGVHGMFDSPDLIFSDDMKSVSIKEGNSGVKYYFSDASILTTPQKDIKMPPAELSFTLTDQNLSAIRKASSALGLTELVIKKDGDSLVGVVTDSANATSNEFSIDLDFDTCTVDGFEYIYSIPNFKFMAGDYKVDISSKLISKFTSTEAEYFVALEKSSKTGV